MSNFLLWVAHNFLSNLLHLLYMSDWKMAMFCLVVYKINGRLLRICYYTSEQFYWILWIVWQPYRDSNVLFMCKFQTSCHINLIFNDILWFLIVKFGIVFLIIWFHVLKIFVWAQNLKKLELVTRTRPLGGSYLRQYLSPI